MTDDDVLWQPTPAARSTTALGRFATAAEQSTGLTFAGYEDLWRWSTTDLDGFWAAVWRWFDVPADTPADGPGPALAHEAMPGSRWFTDVRLSYAEAMLRLPGRADDDVVVVARSQSRDEVRLTAAGLRDAVARARAGLVRLGVSRGDRVAAYAPNIPETLVLLLATASLGAIFSSCAPEFGTRSVVDRWQQIEPTVLLAVDGYRYGDKPVSRRDEVDAIRAGLPSLQATVWLPYLDADASAPDGALTWDDLLAEPADLAFDRVPFDHPLYVLFSSGTTGLPKPIVHGHGGIMLEHLKGLGLQMDLGPTDTFFWFSTTGWMMWNLLVSGLAVGSTVVLVDGNPAHPDLGALWRLADELGITYFGTSAPFLLQCRKEGLEPREVADLSRLRAVGSTGAPLPVEGFYWVHDAVGPDVHLESVSGGTDVCSAFVGASPLSPVRAGRISCRCLGSAVAAYDEQARPVVGEVGELVIERPTPSMPVGFWGDDDGSRYRDAYFADIPGVWRHGDWISIDEDGSSVLSGRSDATLNRGGVRLGTAEFYSVVEDLDEVADSLVVHLEDPSGGAGTLMLFVVLAEGTELDDALRREVASALRGNLSPRHVPDELHAVPSLPRTLSGKKLEVPVKKILRGADVDDAAARGALANPESLDAFVAFRPS
ncbi:acetoacetate--CoA ligase [Solicola sp. PLA-1-18]|uniref:acetoacetate--CoA ligase n=1 Tax=Solicola sp. PLA-1-18 TaxID=3380532 RepID=UPI003B8069BC